MRGFRYSSRDPVYCPHWQTVGLGPPFLIASPGFETPVFTKLFRFHALVACGVQNELRGLCRRKSHTSLQFYRRRIVSVIDLKLYTFIYACVLVLHNFFHRKMCSNDEVTYFFQASKLKISAKDRYTRTPINRFYSKVRIKVASLRKSNPKVRPFVNVTIQLI